MPLENKKQIMIIGGALILGILAVVLTAHYIQVSNQEQAQKLREESDAKQQKMAMEFQQRSEQQAAELRQEIERSKAEQAEAMQKVVVALQAAQQQAARQQEEAQVKKIRHPSLALKTPVGKRAVTIKIDSLAAVGGLLNAGDFVDVIAQLNVPSQDPDKKTVTAMIFQGLQVLAIDTNQEDPGDYDRQQSANTLKITVAVDPQEAGLLAFSDKNGNLELALRSPDDNMHQMVKADTWKTLADYVLKNQGLDIQDPDGDNAHKPVDNTPAIQIFRGGKEL